MKNDKELNEDMLETMNNFKTMMGIFLAITDVSSYDDIIKLRQIGEVANSISDLIDFYI